MEKRCVYEVLDKKPYFRRKSIDMSFPKGWFRNPITAVEVLHKNYKSLYDDTKSLFEISSAADDVVGKKLSALNLKDEKGRTVECVFQSSKKFENGGPYLDLLNVSSKQAKKDKRLKESGRVIAFIKDGIEYPTKPVTAFYDYIYISTLINNKDLCDLLDTYDAFTDIWFNPKNSLNCQAEAIAIYRGLKKSNNLDKAMKSFDDFVNEVFVLTV